MSARAPILGSGSIVQQRRRFGKVVSYTRWEFLDREGFSIAHNVREEGVLLTGTAT
jgi:hypothetical protein